MIALKDRFGRFFNVQAEAEHKNGFALVALSKLGERDSEVAKTRCNEIWHKYNGTEYKFYRFNDVAAACIKQDEKEAKRKNALAALAAQELAQSKPAPKTTTITFTLVVGSGAREIVGTINAEIPEQVLTEAIAKATAYLESELGGAKLRANGSLAFALQADVKVMQATTKVEITREF